MDYTFTDRVRQVLSFAREEAQRLQHDHVGTEHLLLGLVREGGGVAVAVLTNLSVESARLTERVEALAGRGKGARSMGELPYTSRGKKVLELAMSAARELGHRYVGTEHLLLALLREGSGIAWQVLTQLGVTYEAARDETLRLLGARPEGKAERADPGRSWLRQLLRQVPEVGGRRTGLAIALDDTSSASIYEQIIAQIQEAVATGRLRPGDRLPTVRRLADELDIAPGTVARAYGELERLGVVVTEGARGTRVADASRPVPSDSQRTETLVGLLRPVAVAAFHLGATGSDLKAALEQAMRGIYVDEGGAPS